MLVLSAELITESWLVLHVLHVHVKKRRTSASYRLQNFIFTARKYYKLQHDE
jgi:hypothetical protein